MIVARSGRSGPEAEGAATSGHGTAGQKEPEGVATSRRGPARVAHAGERMTVWRSAPGLSITCTLALMLGCSPPAEPETFAELAEAALPQIEGEIPVASLEDDVEVIRDPWGVPHIYASNLDDLFRAQGFIQAQDRLWQMDMYRRTGEGRLAEIMGPEYVNHDRFARLFGYRGPWTDEEYSKYHPEGRRILEAFTEGVNAYIDHARAASELPLEYALTGLEPERWTPQASLLRMQTAMPLGDARRELRLARSVDELGAEEANRRANPSPFRPLVVPEGVDYSLITEEVAAGLSGFRGGTVRPELAAPFQEWLGAIASENLGARETSPGSNNWVVAPELTATGAVFMANDPHRGVTNPSLRYVVHLEAPGWSAIGSTEPVLPGVAIGHNGQVAWGLTIVGTDQSDVYVETVNPSNPREVLWQGAWEPVEVVVDTIFVLDSEPVVVELEYTRHGPIFYRDSANALAYSFRSTMYEPGTTGYLPALRLNVTSDCAAFLDALDYWAAPTENMMCGDSAGNIAWQAAALSPRRDGWDGRLPVPGDGSHEWTGFRDDLPEEYNPARGWIATANHDIHPEGYDPPLFFKSGTSYPRFERLREVLSEGGDFTLGEMIALQQDSYSASGDALNDLFAGWTSSEERIETARAEIAEWDARYDRSSRAAAIFGELRNRIPATAREPGTPPSERRALLEPLLLEALDELGREQGPDPDGWRWGRTHRSEFPHALVSEYDLPAIERSGGAGTVAATGATYRHIVDFSDLDRSVFTNAPGQSGRPGSPYYGNLAEQWGAGDYFPLLYTREAVEGQADRVLTLAPPRRR